MTHDRRLLILVVEDEADQREIVATVLQGAGYSVLQAGTAEKALQLLATHGPRLLVCDWKLPGRNGMWLLDQVQRAWPDAGFIMATAYGSIAHAVEAVRAGADDYLTKPFQRQVLLLAVERALRSRELLSENRRLSEALGERERLRELVGRSPAMQQIYQRLEKVATTEATVLITGESGTGKELAARTIHQLSKRAQNSFVVVNCAAIPEGLVEAELFGAEKGAYTGADRQRNGYFEKADRGTIFLDEIGDLPLSLQPKLLRVLQEGKFNRVGNPSEVTVDVRILAATNRNLEEAIREKTFRDDLYYRLNIVPVRMPALRERSQDIPALVDHFLTEYSRKYSVSLKPLPRVILKQLVDHPWPGNVRELSNIVERLTLLSEDGRVKMEDLPTKFRSGSSDSGGFEIPVEGIDWQEHEKACLQQVLRRSAGNRARAARLLNLPYKAFLYRLEKYGIEGL